MHDAVCHRVCCVPALCVENCLVESVRGYGVPKQRQLWRRREHPDCHLRSTEVPSFCSLHPVVCPQRVHQSCPECMAVDGAQRWARQQQRPCKGWHHKVIPFIQIILWRCWVHRPVATVTKDVTEEVPQGFISINWKATCNLPGALLLSSPNQTKLTQLQQAFYNSKRSILSSFILCHVPNWINAIGEEFGCVGYGKHCGRRARRICLEGSFDCVVPLESVEGKVREGKGREEEVEVRSAEHTGEGGMQMAVQYCTCTCASCACKLLHDDVAIVNEVCYNSTYALCKARENAVENLFSGLLSFSPRKEITNTPVAASRCKSISPAVQPSSMRWCAAISLSLFQIIFKNCQSNGI